MQQSMQMAAMPGAPPANITTEQIQKYLDENKQLILAILENQNLGKLSECAQYQAQLQKNLLYLAAIADAQPQSPSIRPQTPGTMTPGGAMPAMPPGAMPVLPAGMSPQAAAQYMQQQQMFPQRMPLQESSLQQTPPHQGMGFGGQMGLRPGMAMNGLHHHHPHHHGSMHADPTGKLDVSGSEPGEKERSSGGENNDGEK